MLFEVTVSLDSVLKRLDTDLKARCDMENQLYTLETLNIFN